MAVSVKLSVTQNSQSIANNTSSVTVKLDVYWTNGSWNHLIAQTTGWVEVDGTRYTFAKTFNPNKTSSGNHNLFTKTFSAIPHNADGTKTLQCSASYNARVSTNVATDSMSKVLTTIPRKSTLTVSNGTLGTAQTLKITEKASAFNHRLYYTCGNSGNTYILGSSSSSSSALSTSWTPPASLARYNTTGRSVSVTFTLQTYSGSTLVGSNTYTKTFAIPSSVKPKVSFISVSDPMGYFSKYGGYVQGFSKMKVTVTPTLAYGSSINSYRVNANGTTYLTASFTTDVVKTSNASTNIVATVTDARGYSSDAKTSNNLHVLAYSAPAVSKFIATRCNEDGTVNDRGDHVKFTYKFGISGDTESAWTTKNTVKSFKIEYKKSNETAYTTLVTSGTADAETTTGTFTADVSSSYNARITITDDFKTTTKNIVVATGFTLMSWNAAGNGMAIGKISELGNVFDVALQARFRDILCLANNKNVYVTDANGNDMIVMSPCNADGNLELGYGQYANKSGNTTVCGKDVTFAVSSTPSNTSYRPYRRAGDVIPVTVKTAGYVTNGGQDVSFNVPLPYPILGSPAITVESTSGLVIRQGGNYLYGSTANASTTASSYTVSRYDNGLTMVAHFTNTTDVSNNDSIGVYWAGTIKLS